MVVLKNYYKYVEKIQILNMLIMYRVPNKDYREITISAKLDINISDVPRVFAL